MRKSLLSLVVVVLVAMAVVATAAGAPAHKTPYRSAALKCNHRRNLEAVLHGKDIPFLRSSFVPCVIRALHGPKPVAGKLASATLKDARQLIRDRLGPRQSAATAQAMFDHTGGQLCSSKHPNSDWAWMLADNAKPQAASYILLAKELWEDFFANSRSVGKEHGATITIQYLHSIFFHQGHARDAIGIAGFSLVCPPAAPAPIATA
ncbi:MAG: hypothetical protein J2O48_09875 [Solirubrobacterales bacterium]|nr:hypothetical protein [Solirubrobacterales bacterium]